ncbi:MAG: lysophospholipid acyltransferase family protein [Gemmatimonadota bacterium]
MIRTAWVLFAGLVTTAYCASVVTFSARFRKARLPCVCEGMPRAWARAVLRLAGVKVRLLGDERMDWDRPLVVVANHQSWFDVFALAAYLPTKARFVAKQELGRIPIFGKAWKACGHISVDRSDRKQAVESLQHAGRRVRDEKLVMILFPEGTRSPDGRLQPFKKGAFVLAIETGVPLVPLGITGSREVMAKGSFRIHPGEITIRVGEPIGVEGLGHENRDELLKRSRAAVAALIGQSLGAGNGSSPAVDDFEETTL